MESKSRLRLRMIRLRSEMTSVEVQRRSRKVLRRLAAEISVSKSESILIYLSAFNEVDTDLLVESGAALTAKGTRFDHFLDPLGHFENVALFVVY